jgi:hypothetical protein
LTVHQNSRVEWTALIYAKLAKIHIRCTALAPSCLNLSLIALYAEANRHFRAGLARPANFDYRAGRIQLRIYRDELALGLTCNGQVALAARETEHVLATAGR